MNLLDEIATERSRQKRKGWTDKHDDWHVDGELAAAGAAFALLAAFPADGVRKDELRRAARIVYPWDDGFTTRGLRRQDLIRAIGLLVAEVERLDRSGAPRDGFPLLIVT